MVLRLWLILTMQDGLIASVTNHARNRQAVLDEARRSADEQRRQFGRARAALAPWCSEWAATRDTLADSDGDDGA